MSQSVTLISISQPTKYTGAESADELVAWAARVSNPSNQNNTETAGKLVKYLVKNYHWSPLELVSIGMEIHTTRDIARQIIRHRSFSFQEYSQRYADPTKDLRFFDREARLQDLKNRQNSIETEDRALNEEFRMRQKTLLRSVNENYKWAIEKGIAKEQARALLPEGLTESVLIMHGSLRSWVHYIELRTDAATQKEHREIAQMCKEIIAEEFTSVAEALNWS